MTSSFQDTELLRRWGNGDRAAGGELIERHFATVFRFFRTKVHGEVDDLVQQTFLACLEARQRYREESSFKTFLLGIARYQLFSHYRMALKLKALDPEVTSLRDLGTSPSGHLARRDERTVLLDALRCIPLELQIVLELVYWEELDGPMIAQMLEIPLNTAYSKLRRAKAALREQLRESKPKLAVLSADPECFDDWARRMRTEHGC